MKGYCLRCCLFDHVVGRHHTFHFRYKNGPFSHLENLDLSMLSQAVTDDVLAAVSASSGLRSLSLAFCGMVSVVLLLRDHINR